MGQKQAATSARMIPGVDGGCPAPAGAVDEPRRYLESELGEAIRATADDPVGRDHRW